MQLPTNPMTTLVYFLGTALCIDHQTQWDLGCIVSVCPYRLTGRRNESWRVYSLYVRTEWLADPMSPGVYSLWRPYRMTTRPNESWTVFSLYVSTQWPPDQLSAGVYSLCRPLQNDHQTLWVLECVLSVRYYALTSRPNDLWRVLSAYVPTDDQQTQRVLRCNLSVRPYRITSRSNSPGVYSLCM